MHLTFGSRYSKVATAALLTLAVGFTASCTIENGEPGIEEHAVTQSAEADQDQQDSSDGAQLTASIKDKATEVSVAKPIEVKADGKLDKVTLLNPAGEEVEGKLSQDKKTWKSSEKLAYGSTYTLKANAGKEKLNKTFTTVQAAMVNSSGLSPLDQSTVGVAQSISLFFNSPVQDKKAVEEAISVETSNDTEGAFYWLTDQSLRWRPKEFWKPGTTVDVKANLYGVDMGGGVYGDEDRSASFTIGDDVRAVVDDSTKQMTITKNGEVIKTMPVSNGRNTADWATPNGIYTVGDQHDSIVMDSNTFGLPVSEGGYVTPVQYATQMSWSGIYIHAAPWSEWAQGSQNTSHGCINVSTANANWVYENLKRGDPVVVKNTVGTELNGHDGLGDWQIPWEKWSKGNSGA